MFNFVVVAWCILGMSVFVTNAYSGPPQKNPVCSDPTPNPDFPEGGPAYGSPAERSKLQLLRAVNTSSVHLEGTCYSCSGCSPNYGCFVCSGVAYCCCSEYNYCCSDGLYCNSCPTTSTDTSYTDDSSDDDGGGVSAGGIVGIVFGVIFALAFIACVCRRNRAWAESQAKVAVTTSAAADSTVEIYNRNIEKSAPVNATNNPQTLNLPQPVVSNVYSQGNAYLPSVQSVPVSQALNLHQPVVSNAYPAYMPSVQSQSQSGIAIQAQPGQQFIMVQNPGGQPFYVLANPQPN
jgi:hypothetical protein